MAAGLATLNELTHPAVYTQLETTTQQVVTGIKQRAAAAKIPVQISSIGGLFGLVFTEQEEPITRYQHVITANKERFKRFFHAMLAQGIYLAPSAFEADFVTLAHGEPELHATLQAAEHALSRC